MNPFLIVVAIIVWFVSGSTAFYYYWKRDYNYFTPLDYFMMVLIGVTLGPLAWPIGYLVHDQNRRR